MKKMFRLHAVPPLGLFLFLLLLSLLGMMPIAFSQETPQKAVLAETSELLPVQPRTEHRNFNSPQDDEIRHQLLIQAKKILKEAKKKYPNANTVLMRDVIDYDVEENGRYLSFDDTAVLILTDRGLRENQLMSEGVDLRTSVTCFDALEIIDTQTGKRRILDPAQQSKLTTDNSQMADNIYDPLQKVLQVTVPNLKKGDIVRYLIRRELLRPRLPNRFFDIQLLEYLDPILHYEVTYRLPATLPLQKYQLYSPVEKTVSFQKRELPATEKQPARLEYTWIAKDVPQLIPEPKMPGLSSAAQRILVSTQSSWKEVSRWYWELCKPHLVCNEAMKQKIKELTARCQGPEEKMNAIFQFVSQEVRYMGETTENTAPGYEPHDAIATFEKRHGVCRDKAALLASLLREAGFEAYPVLIYVGPKREKEVPLPWFNHAITALRMTPESNWILMDATCENSAILFPGWLANCSYLVATPQGEELQTSSVPPASPDNLLKIQTIAHIDAAGTFQGETTIDFHGINDNIYRGYLAHLTHMNQQKYFTKVLRKISPTANIVRWELTPEDPRDTQKELSLKLIYQIPHFLVRKEKSPILFVPPYLSNAFNLPLRLFGLPTLSKRRFDMLTDTTAAVEENLLLYLDASWGNILSAPTDFARAGGPLTCSMATLFNPSRESTLNSIFFTANYSLQGLTLKQEDYHSYRECQKALRQHQEKIIRLTGVLPPEKPEENAADQDMLSSLIQIDLQDKNHHCFTQQFQTRVLTYNGLKQNGEFTIGILPDLEQLKSIKASVTSPNGKLHQLTEKELRLALKPMDAPHNASAPRYPKSRKLVLTLPQVEIGSIIEISFTIQRKNMPIHLLQYLQDTNPRQNQKIILQGPAALIEAMQIQPPERKTGAPLVHVTQEQPSPGIRKITWDFGKMAQLPPEDNTPPSILHVPHFAITSFTSWNQLLQNFLPYMQKLGKMPLPEEARLRLDKIKRQSPLKQAEALRLWVENEVRTDGITLYEGPIHQLFFPPEVTLKDGYGNIPDKAILYAAMLRYLGYEPHFLFGLEGSSLKELQKTLPHFVNPTLISDTLVSAQIGGRTVYFNDNNNLYNEPGATTAEEILVLDEQGKFLQIQPVQNLKAAVPVKYTIYLDKEGNAKLFLEKKFYGYPYAAAKMEWKEETPEETKRVFESMLLRLSPAAVPLSQIDSKYKKCFRQDFDRYPGLFYLAAYIPNFAHKIGDALQLRLPYTPSGMNLPELYRQLPLLKGDEGTTDVTIQLYLTDFQAYLLKAPEGLWKYRPITNKKSKIIGYEFTYKLDSPAKLFSPQQYPQFRKEQEDKNNPLNQIILLGE